MKVGNKQWQVCANDLVDTAPSLLALLPPQVFLLMCCVCLSPPFCVLACVWSASLQGCGLALVT